MSLVSDVLTFSRVQAQTNADGLSNANGLVWANEAMLDFRRRLQAAGVDASQLQEAYRDGTANQGTYLYPDDMFWLKAIELNYTDTSAENYKTAQQVDVSNIPGGKSFSWLRSNASANAPLFDDRGDWYEIFPTPTGGDNVSQLIRLFYYLEPTEYASVGDTIVYPENLDYRILGWRIAASYLYSLGENKINQGDAFNAKYEERVRQLIATLSRGSQQPIKAVPIQDNGWGY